MTETNKQEDLEKDKRIKRVVPIRRGNKVPASSKWLESYVLHTAVLMMPITYDVYEIGECAYKMMLKSGDLK